MSRSIELVLQEGESLASALRRFKAKVQEDSGSGKRPKAIKQGALLEMAIQEARALPPKSQNAVAEAILAKLRDESDPTARRFQELVEAKYTRGLSAAESSELDRLEGGFHDSDEAFYGPILERLKSRKTGTAKRRSA
ncbi:MAG: hypothetical protein NTW74_04430 [Acidobacteria bacterium]|nr:hypothetical protein [Acidobacteriota bacterium]